MTFVIVLVLALLAPFSGVVRDARLQITKTVSANPMIIGAESVYTVTVRNTGDQDATDVTMTDTLPDTLTVGALPSGCSATGQTVTCGGPGLTLAPGQEESWMIPVTVDPGLSDGTNIRNTAKATSSSAAGVSTDLISQTQTMADVEITKTAPDTVDENGTITYTLTVTNHGPSDAVDVTVQDPTNGNLTTIIQLPAECPASGLTVTCPIGTLKPGETRTFTFTVQVKAPPGTQIDNCATVYTGSRESTTDNNQSCAGTAVVPLPTPTPTPSPSPTPDAPHLVVDKEGPAVTRPGGSYVYRVTVTNQGGATAANVRVSDPISPLLTVNPMPDGCAMSGATLVCAIGDLQPGESKTLTIRVTVDADAPVGTHIVNCAVTGTTTRHSRSRTLGACVNTEVKDPTPTPTPSPTSTPSPSPSPSPSPTASHSPSPTPAPTHSGPQDPGPRKGGDLAGPMLPMSGGPILRHAQVALLLIAFGLVLRWLSGPGARGRR